MKIKSIFLIVTTALVTLVIVQNNEPVNVRILWTEVQMSKLILLLCFFLIGLIVGLVIRLSSGTKKLVIREDGQKSDLDDEDREFLS